MKYITSSPAIWDLLLIWALAHADNDSPALYSSRIDGLIFPHCGEWL